MVTLFRFKRVRVFVFLTLLALTLSFSVLNFWIFVLKGQSVEQTIYQRTKLARDMCKVIAKTDYWKNATPSAQLFTHEGITYCRTEKVGCTFWLRVMRFLAKDFNPNLKQVLKPSDIGRYYVHYAPYKNLTLSKFNKPFGQLILSTTKSFMFTRHPLTRLWSAYVDKFLLPDFWIYIAVGIGKAMRPELKGKNVTCVKDLSFNEFIEYIVKYPIQYQDKHWKPVHLLCSPCHAHFDVIGKQETFSTDAAYVIDKFGLKDAEEKIKKEFRVQDEIDMIVRYNFGLEKILKRKECYDPFLITKRLWQAFQFNGYIHRSFPFPDRILDDDRFQHNASSVLLASIIQTIGSHTKEMKEELKYQKVLMTKEVYQKLPGDLLHRLKQFYKYDFELFSYDPDLFG